MKFMFTAALLLALLNTLPALAADNVNIVRWAEGTIEYRKLSTGEVTGSESFHLTVHPDGSRTLQARNRLDQAGYQRHVTHRVNADFRPLETTAVYWVKGAWRGAGLFAVDGHQLTAIAQTPDGMITQVREVPEFFSFIPHPLSTNAWHAWYYDKDIGGKQPITVYDMDAGAASPMSLMGTLHQQEIEFLGSERLRTPAGRFETDHYNINSGVDLYVTGPDMILVRFLWIPADAEYVLTTLKTGP